MQGAFLTYEYLEVPFQDIARHANDVIFHELEILVRGKGLGDGPEEHFLFRFVQGVAFQGSGLEGVDVPLVYAFLVIQRHARLAGHLMDVVFRHSDHYLCDLYVQLLFGIPYQGFQRFGHLHGVEDIAVPDSFRGSFLVIDHLYVIPVDAGYCKGHLV